MVITDTELVIPGELEFKLPLVRGRRSHITKVVGSPTYNKILLYSGDGKKWDEALALSKEGTGVAFDLYTHRIDPYVDPLSREDLLYWAQDHGFNPSFL